MKKALSLILAAVLALALGGTALAKVPDKPDTFAYFYDYDGSVLSSGDKQTIADLLKATGKAAGGSVSLGNFFRIQLGAE